MQHNVLRPGRGKDRPLTGRERLMAGDLQWEPLPPGKLFVKRGSE
ncbi:hypothetical protein [[Pseudopropionibacterium] massiliense]|nr:hypothetical protein [[Pseudopropionibacterium] massiliense]